MDEETAELEGDEDRPICLYCGKDNPPAAPFCVHCHQPLGAVASLGPIENMKYSPFKTFEIADPTYKPITFYTLSVLFVLCFAVLAVALVDSIRFKEGLVYNLAYGFLCTLPALLLFYTTRKYLKAKASAKQQQE